MYYWWAISTDWDLFRCSTFWAFSLLKYELMGIRNCMLWFRCSTFWTFSLSSLLLYHEWDSLNVSMLNFLSFFFIWCIQLCKTNDGRKSFDAQCFELFLYMKNRIIKLLEERIAFRCSMFWAFSLLASRLMMNADIYVCVSMLNVLSFFFINAYGFFESVKKIGFDAQCFELFLYLRKEFWLWTWGERVSMLNVLSFFFIQVWNYHWQSFIS